MYPGVILWSWRFLPSCSFFTSPRLRGEVGSRSDPGEGDSPRVRMRGESPSPQPSPREERREGAERASSPSRDAHLSFVKIILPDAADIPQTPWQTQIFASGPS